MRIKFLVVLAVICLCAHYASASGMGGGDKKAEKPEKSKKEAVKAVATPDPVSEEYDVQVIKHKKEKTEKKDKEKKTHIEVRKEVKKKEVKFIPCSERVKEDKLACETKDVPAGYKGVFTYKDDEDCDWNCDYEALPQAAGEKKDVKKEKKVVKVVKPPKEKKEKKPKKECSGEKVIKFQNCLVKIRGLIAFGDKTKNFDKKFAKLVQGKAKKGAKKAKGGKKGGKKDKKTAVATTTTAPNRFDAINDKPTVNGPPSPV